MPETLAEKIARLERERSSPSRNTAPEILAAKIARLEGSAAGRDQTPLAEPGTHVDPRPTRERVASGLANLTDALLLGGLDEAAWLFGAPDRAGSYQAMKELREGGRQYDPTGTTVARAVGSVAPLFASMGTTGGVEAAPSLARQMATAGGIGATAGALSDGTLRQRGVNAVMSGLLTSLFPPALQGGVALASKVPGVAAMSARAGVPIGASGKAVDEIAAHAKPTEAFPVASVPRNPTLPPMALDEGGASLEALAADVLRRPGVGNDLLSNALRDRMAGSRAAVTGALESTTGVSKAIADKTIVASEEAQAALNRQIARAAELQKEATMAAREATRASAPTPQMAVAAFSDEVGGNIENGIQRIAASIKDKTTTANELFAEARRLTADQTISSPSLEKFRATPLGKMAEGWADRQMLNAGLELPTKKAAGTLPGFSEAQTEKWMADMQARGLDIPAGAVGEGEIISLINPEKLHYMKRFVAIAAKNPMRAARMAGLSELDSKVASEAANASRQWDVFRNELPPVWRAADDATAAKWRLIRANEMGLDAAKALTAPASKKALTGSVEAVKQKFAEMSPEEQGAFRETLRFSLAERLRGMSPKTARTELADPQSALSQMTELATGDAAAAARIADRLQPQKFVAGQVPVPTKSPVQAATDRGLAILRTPELPDGANASGSMPVLQRDLLGMAPDEVAGLRQGAASALRNEWEGVGTSGATPGAFFAASPERITQTRLAFKSPLEHQSFQSTVSAHNKAQAQFDRLLGRSGVNVPQAERLSKGQAVLPQAAEAAAWAGTGHPIMGAHRLRPILNKLFTGSNPKVDEEIARHLIAPSLNETLSQAAQRRIAKTVGARGILGVSNALRDAAQEQGLLDIRRR